MPNNVTVMNNLAWAGLQLHRPDALAMAQRASELASPPTPAIMDTLAAALAADRQFSKAIAVQQEAVRLSGGDPDFRLALAKLYVASGDRPRARSELDELSSGGKAFKGQAEVAALRASLR
jgi:Flp pilus assembly protein TadD